MSESIQYESGREGARTIRVWDPLVRLIHWSVVLGILLNAALTDPEGLLHEYVGYAVLGLVLCAWPGAPLGRRRPGSRHFRSARMLRSDMCVTPSGATGRFTCRTILWAR